MNSHADYILYPGWPSASLYLNLKYFYNGITIMMGWCILYTDQFLFFSILYLVLAVFLCLAICAVVGVIFFPRTVSIKLVGASPKNISIPSSNYSDPVIIINVSE